MIKFGQRMLMLAMGALLIGCIILLYLWVNFLRSPVVTADQGLQYTIPPGVTLRFVTNDLYLQNVIKHPDFFNLMVYLKGAQHQLKAGEYLFPKGTTPLSLLAQITTGSGMIYHTFTIVSGWSFKQLRNALAHDSAVLHLSSPLSDEAIMTKINHSQLNPEGQFFPDTYYFVKGSSDIALLKRAYNLMQKKLNDAWRQRDPSIPFQTNHQALIAASIIEKEAYLDAERPMIAGVLINRLKKNMLLQFDPTVIYGLGSRYHGKIHKEDLLQSSPYNTYVHKGLPPTPISMPSMGSIRAIMHPQQNDFIYFVARGDGTHQFSSTLAQHHLAVKEAREHVIAFFNYPLIRLYLTKQIMKNIFFAN
jgi:UPF0755 protein